MTGFMDANGDVGSVSALGQTENDFHKGPPTQVSFHHPPPEGTPEENK